MTGPLWHKQDEQSQRQILLTARVIAVVGFSPDPTRVSHQIGRFLQNAGYKVYPVNPTVSMIDGEPVYASLADIPETIDIVNVFRRSEYLPSVVEEAVAVRARAVWAQLGVSSEEAREIASDAFMPIIMNNCIKVAYSRLVGTR